LGTKTDARGSFYPIDEAGNEINILKASRDYSSVGGRIEIHPAGMTSGKRFLFTTYHELTHAKMFYNGDMHNRYRFLEMNYTRFNKLSSSISQYYNVGLNSFAERWAYGAQWSRWRINGDKMKTFQKMWYDYLNLVSTP
jgi:hypothetical protein